MSNSTNSVNNFPEIIYIGSSSSSSEITIPDLNQNVNAPIDNNNESYSVNQSDGVICLGSTHHENVSHSVNQFDGIISSVHGTTASADDDEDEAISVDQSELCPLQVVFPTTEDVDQDEMNQTPPNQQTRSEGRRGYQSLRANAEPPSRRRSTTAPAPTSAAPPQPRRTTALMMRAENHPEVIAQRLANARRARQANKRAGGHSK